MNGFRNLREGSGTAPYQDECERTAAASNSEETGAVVKKLSCLTSALAILMVMFAAPDARAATDNVDCFPAALVAAINTANQDATPDTLKLAKSCVYELESAYHDGASGPTGLPRVTTAITIVGQGALIRRAQGAADFRIFEVGSNAAYGGALVLEGLTVSGGRAVGDSGGGIFVHNNGDLKLIRSTVGHNYSSVDGGGIFSNGDLAIIDSTITSNNAHHSGGGIFAAVVTVTNSAISWNNAADGPPVDPATYSYDPYFEGGGIAAARATVTGAVFDHNTAPAGGAIATGSLSAITRSLFFANVGGGVYFKPGGWKSFEASVTESTFTVNHPYAITAPTESTTLVLLQPLDLTIVNSTFFAWEDSTHILARGGLTVRNSTLVGGETGVVAEPVPESPDYAATFTNSIVTGASHANCSGALDGEAGVRNNLSDDDTCGPTFSVVDPMLGTLKLNGSVIPTIAPLPGSPAIDTGDLSPCPHGDQRGFTRPADGDLNGYAACDIGAFEVGAADVSITKEGDGAVSPGETLTYTINIRNTHGSATATDVEMIDDLPSGTVLESVRTSQGECTADANGEMETVRCTLGALEERKRATITIVVRVTEPESTLIVNTARLATSSPDPNLRNNAATASTDVRPALNEPAGA